MIYYNIFIIVYFSIDFATCEINRTLVVQVAPCDGVTIKLQELEQLMCLLSISSLFLGCQSVVGHQQRMRSAT